MTRKFGKYDHLFQPVVYVICRNGKPNGSPLIKEYGMKNIIELTSDKELYVDRERYPFIESKPPRFLESLYRSILMEIERKSKPKCTDPELEACRREVNRDNELVKTGIIKDRKGNEGQSVREKRMRYQNLGYTDWELEQAKRVFGGCPRELVAEEVLCVDGMKPEKAMQILPYLGVHLSKKEVEKIYIEIPDWDKNTIKSIHFFNSKEYKAPLDAFKNRPPSPKDNKCAINSSPSAAPQGTPSP